MVLVGKIIKMLDELEIEGIEHPLRFGFVPKDSNMLKTVNINKINKIEKKRVLGETLYFFYCESKVEDQLYEFDIAHVNGLDNWVLTRVN